MLFRGTVATLARDFFLREGVRFVAVQSTRNVPRLSRVTQKALFRGWAREIGIGQLFKTRREIVRMAFRVITDRGLEEVVANAGQVAGCMGTRAYDVVDSDVKYIAGSFDALPSGFFGGIDGERRAGCVAKRTGRFMGGSAK